MAPRKLAFEFPQFSMDIPYAQFDEADRYIKFLPGYTMETVWQARVCVAQVRQHLLSSGQFAEDDLAGVHAHFLPEAERERRATAYKRRFDGDQNAKLEYRRQKRRRKKMGFYSRERTAEEDAELIAAYQRRAEKRAREGRMLPTDREFSTTFQ